MIRTKKELEDYILQDRSRYGCSRKSRLLNTLLYREQSKILRLLEQLRKCEYAHYCRNKSLWHKVNYYIQLRKYNKIQFETDTYIGLNMCGPGLWLPHMGGIVVNCKSMGRNCSITKGVVIGNKAGSENMATIGDNCYFTLGCKVIGAVIIGNNVIVAQNAVVTKDVANNTLVGGIPARPIKSFNSINEINI